MSDLAPADIAARVVAWHNRHPLARRLRPADVHSVGHVALPFQDGAAAPAMPAAAAAGSLRERAMARAREAPEMAAPVSGAGPLQPAFRDDFIPPLAPDEVAAFAARHGIERSTEPTGAPIRRVPAATATGALAWRWLWTAEVRTDAARTRVLLGPAPGAPVLGRRLWSLPRVGALAALGGAAVALALASGVFDGRGADAVATLPAPQPASAAMAAATPPARSAGPDVAASAAPAAPASSLAPAATASRPLDVEPRLGRIELPPIGGIVDARRREAAEKAAAAASAASAAPATAAGRPASAPAITAPSAPAFALTTRLLRTRTESQQIAEALTGLLVVPGSPVQKVEVLRVGDDFRVVAWPYPSRAEAERAQAAMQARGHRLQLIDF